MAQVWKWSFWEAFSIFLKTYVEDWGGADNVRRKLVSGSAISEITIENNITGLMAGEGQPVIFIHGTPGNSLRWKTYFNDIPEGYCFISIDRRGFGRRGDQLPDLEKDCKQLSYLIQMFSDPILVGHSLGGALAVRLAATQPVKGLVLVAASINPKLESILPVQRIGKHPLVSWLLSKSIHHSNLEMFHLQRFQEVTEPHLNNLLTSVHIVHAQNDVLVPIDNIDYAQKKFINATLKITSPDAGGHAIAWNKPELVLDAIKNVPRSGGK